MNTKEIKPKGFWTLDNVIKESTKYKTKEEFKKGSHSAYNFYIRNKLYDIIILEGRKNGQKRNV